jgi:hypothetical protein
MRGAIIPLPNMLYGMVFSYSTWTTLPLHLIWICKEVVMVYLKSYLGTLSGQLGKTTKIRYSV